MKKQYHIKSARINRHKHRLHKYHLYHCFLTSLLHRHMNQIHRFELQSIGKIFSYHDDYKCI
uniref:Uncharacterized protein n=1 Tax=Siphoviridae sp. ctx7r16 TaxID=2825738 RepID=A0A8S5NVJ8_9CAUD|nr:MAG TPA: hypothetical protein [Siphoviridae sp. ctx7r16]